eukprot:TRINITY_DN5706_c0_g1_i2.p1 TRINITY_DN5706_c0_g1~~TRINITY_DN5706_c0_g1_i2.p1  ORF type:complete len:677 (+),score=112.59 TRINITY_DN5706_c0_g1_i2:30-2060(+)
MRGVLKLQLLGCTSTQNDEAEPDSPRGSLSGVIKIEQYLVQSPNLGDKEDDIPAIFNFFVQHNSPFTLEVMKDQTLLGSLSWRCSDFSLTSSWKTTTWDLPLEHCATPMSVRFSVRFIVLDPSVLSNVDAIFTGYDKYGFPYGGIKLDKSYSITSTQYYNAISKESTYPTNYVWYKGMQPPPDWTNLAELAKKGVDLPYKAQYWIRLIKHWRETPNELQISDKWDKGYSEAVKLRVLPETKKQINDDVLRTFSHSSAFSIQTGQLGRVVLTRVLEAITVSTSIGYCQSMSDIAAVLLLVLDEENAWLMLRQIFHSIVPQFHCLHLKGLKLASFTFQVLALGQFPEIASVFDVSIPATGLFLGLFAQHLPLPTLLRLWDILFYYATPALILTGLSFIEILYEQVTKSGNPVTEEFCWKFFKNELRMMYNWDCLLDKTFQVDTGFEKTIDNIIAIIHAKASQDEENKVQRSSLDGVIKFEMKIKDVINKLHILRSNFTHICDSRNTLKKDLFLENFDKIFGSEIIAISDFSCYDILANNIFHFLDFSGRNEVSFPDYCMGLLNLTKTTEKEKITCLFFIFTEGRKSMSGPNCKALFDYLYSTYDKESTDSKEVEMKASLAMFWCFSHPQALETISFDNFYEIWSGDNLTGLVKAFRHVQEDREIWKDILGIKHSHNYS